MEAVFAALASQTRRRMLDLNQNLPGYSVGDVAKYFDCSRIMVLKHLKVWMLHLMAGNCDDVRKLKLCESVNECLFEMHGWVQLVGIVHE